MLRATKTDTVVHLALDHELEVDVEIHAEGDDVFVEILSAPPAVRVATVMSRDSARLMGRQLLEAAGAGDQAIGRQLLEAAGEGDQ